jgi:hypothetical protein
MQTVASAVIRPMSATMLLNAALRVAICGAREVGVTGCRGPVCNE